MGLIPASFCIAMRGSFCLFYLHGLQIDSIDPAFAPATGTPETGGWSTRELRTILRGLDGLHIVSADIVEVAPAYDTNAELTTMAAADVSVSKPIQIPRVA
jgi:arginase family enzyme